MPDPLEVNGQPVPFKVVQFLVDFGYLPDSPAHDPESLRQAIATAQPDYGIPATGDLDPLTLRLFATTPRCGVTDAPSARGQLSRWGLSKLTYFIASRATNARLTTADFDRIIQESFGAVSKCCGLTFERVNAQQEANLVISTGRGRRAGFDGPSGTLAYAYLPPSSDYKSQLSMFFDLDEAWSQSEATNGIILGHVARHEFGHNLGLEHTSTPGQLLLPTYSVRIPTFQTEDIKRLQDRYGKPAVAPTPPTTPVPLPPGSRQVAARVLVDGVVYTSGWMQPEAAALTDGAGPGGF